MNTNLNAMHAKVNRGSKGFTLIELLVVVSIIAILTAVVVVNFSSARAKSRDTKRVSDIAQLNLALTQYFTRCNEYPKVATSLTTSSCIVDGSTVNLGTFINKIPVNPDGSNYLYAYMLDSDGRVINFHLAATLEKDSSASTEKVGFNSNNASDWYTSMTGSQVACGSSNCIDGTVPLVYDVKP